MRSSPDPRLLALVAAVAVAAPAVAVDLDCTAESTACPEVVIEGNPHHELPGVGLSPFRGYGDPSVRADPRSDRLWMSYSYLETLPGAEASSAVSVHLASSDDGGGTWRFRGVLWRSTPETDPSPLGGDAGRSVHEVSTLAPTTNGRRWFGMNFRYFRADGPGTRRPTSLRLRLDRAKRPRRLGGGGPGRAREQSMTGWLTDPAWGSDVDLSQIHPDLEHCASWTEPSLFHRDDTLYLVAQCVVIDPDTGGRVPRTEFLSVFASSGRGAPRRLYWQWLGNLTDWDDARDLGADVLTQAEVTTSRDGSLVLLVTPKRLGAPVEHRGCRALDLLSLDPPLIGRAAGGPIVRADIRSSDSTGLGPGLCSYDPESSTGILFVRTEIDLATPEVVFRLHATGVHP